MSRLAMSRAPARYWPTASRRRRKSLPDGFLVQELVTGGVELILGCHRDAQLGPTILLGMGGVTAELYRDTALRLAPVSRREAEAMIAELKSAPLLTGFRGRPPADVAALVETIVAFSAMIGRHRRPNRRGRDQSAVRAAAGPRRRRSGWPGGCERDGCACLIFHQAAARRASPRSIAGTARINSLPAARVAR